MRSDTQEIPALSILILNQAFYPDVAATAQLVAQLATALARRGHSVTALASARCYDNPAESYPKEETWQGVRIQRIKSTGFGKKAKWRRAADFATYLVNTAWNLLKMPRHDVVIALTSPPLISFLGALMVRLKGGRLVFWVMDLNPDEAIAAGWLRPSCTLAQAFRKMLRYSLATADNVIALDRFMADRLVEHRTPPEKISILPPWSHSEDVIFDSAARHRFRVSHNFESKFVVMYSGNHSPCHPLRTLLLAAKDLRDHPDVHFAFIGGGSEFKSVQVFAKEHKLTNITTLPYQPLKQLSASLSAADLHAVVMGEPFVGIVHPCKIYNILSLGTPVLYIGPERSHIGDLSDGTNSATWLYSARHGDVRTVSNYILNAKRRAFLQVAEERELARSVSAPALLELHVQVVEQGAQAVVAERSQSLCV